MKRKRTQLLSTQAIDELVIAQAPDPSAWEPPVRVRRQKSASVSLPSDLAARAKFFAKLHRDQGLSSWLQRVVEERLDLEEAALSSLKRQLTKKRTPQPA